MVLIRVRAHATSCKLKYPPPAEFPLAKSHQKRKATDIKLIYSNLLYPFHPSPLQTATAILDVGVEGGWFIYIFVPGAEPRYEACPNI